MYKSLPIINFWNFYLFKLYWKDGYCWEIAYSGEEQKCTRVFKQSWSFRPKLFIKGPTLLHTSWRALKWLSFKRSVKQSRSFKEQLGSKGPTLLEYTCNLSWIIYILLCTQFIKIKFRRLNIRVSSSLTNS